MGALKDAARKGRGGDTRLGHLSNGDIVFPKERLDEPTRALVFEIMKKKGIADPQRFQVGHLHNAKNPKTRLPMFMDGSEGGGNAGAGGDSGGAAGGAAGGDSGAGSVGSSDSDTAGGGVGTGTGTGQGATAGNVGGVGGTGGGNVGVGAAPAGIGSATPDAGTPTPTSSNLTGLESATAVESGQIPGTPTGTLTGVDAALSGQLGKAFAPTATSDLGPIAGTAVDALGNLVGTTVQGIQDNPLGALANLGLGFAGPVGLGIKGASALSGVLGGPTVGSLAADLGRGFAGLAENASAGTPGGTNTGPGTGLGTGGPGDPNKDTGAGLRALGGGVGVNLDEMLKGRLGGAQA